MGNRHFAPIKSFALQASEMGADLGSSFVFPKNMYVIIRVKNFSTYIIELLHHLPLDFIKGSVILFFNHLIPVHPVGLMQVELH